MEFQLSCFKSWKMMLWKCFTQYASKFGTQQWPQDWKRSVFTPITKKGNAKECSNYHTIALISHTSKIMLKILQARLQQYVTQELPDAQAGFRKRRGTRDQIANVHWIIEKAREFQKNIYFCFIDYAKAFVWITTNCGKFLKTWEYQTTRPASWESCIQVKKLQNWTWNNSLVPNRKRNTLRLYVVTLLFQIICRVHHAKCQAEWIASWNQDNQEKHQH